MIGIERRLAKLEAASGHTARVTIFITLVPTEHASPATATVGNRVWRREPDELEGTFRRRVAAEAGPPQPGCGAVMVFLE